MKTQFASIILTLASVLTGCASVDKAHYKDPAPDMGGVVILRPTVPFGFGSLGCPKFSVSSGEYKAPPYGGSARFDVQPGTHKITTQTSWCFVHPMELAITVRPGETVFVRLAYVNEPRPGFFQGGHMGDPWSGLEEISKEVAMRALPNP